MTDTVIKVLLQKFESGLALRFITRNPRFVEIVKYYLMLTNLVYGVVDVPVS